MLRDQALKAAAALFFAGAAISALPLLAHKPSPLVGDALEYHRLATSIASTGRFSLDGTNPTAARAPGYPAFLALVYTIAGESPLAVLAVQCVLAGASAAMVFLLGLPDLGRKGALTAGIIAAAHPVLVAYAAIPITETLFIVLMLASLLLYRRYLDRRRPLELAASAVIMGLACLTRAIVLYFPLFWLAFEVAQTRRFPRRAAAWTAIFLLTIAPWTLRNHAQFGGFLPVATGGGYALWAGAHAGAPYPDAKLYDGFIAPYEKASVEGDRLGLQRGKALYLGNLPAIFLDFPRRSVHFWLTSHSAIFGYSEGIRQYRRERRAWPVAVKVGGLLLQTLLLAAGAWGAWKARLLEAYSLPIAMILYTWFFPVMTDYWANRYHVPAIPLLILLAVFAARRYRLQN